MSSLETCGLPISEPATSFKSRSYSKSYIFYGAIYFSLFLIFPFLIRFFVPGVGGLVEEKDLP